MTVRSSSQLALSSVVTVHSSPIAVFAEQLTVVAPITVGGLFSSQVAQKIDDENLQNYISLRL
jgi:hypothetical protein